MAYDDVLAARVRDALADRPVTERKMFGGLAFLLNGNMSVGVIGDELIVRVDPTEYPKLLGRPGCREMDFTGRPMKGWVVVGAEAMATSQAMTAWVRRGAEYASTLPAK